MAKKTKIQWTESTWNPITGCSKVSEGCRNCYALRDWPRLSANPRTVYHGRKFTDVQCHAERLGLPFHWTKPRRIFVNSTSDLFHESVPDDFILQVFNEMRRTTWAGGAGLGRIRDDHREGHVFQVLTKRAERMKDFISRLHFDSTDGYVLGEPGGLGLINNKDIWLGVSVEDQKSADERIRILLEAPVASRWISAEPLLGPLDIIPYLGYRAIQCGCGFKHDESNLVGATINKEGCLVCRKKTVTLPTLDWVVAGGESTSNARPMHPEWIRSLRDQCKETETPFFFKQWGEWSCYDHPAAGVVHVQLDGKFLNVPTETSQSMKRVGKKLSGRELDGVIHDEYPG